MLVRKTVSFHADVIVHFVLETTPGEDVKNDHILPQL